jgi:hypothetical protein
MRAVRLRRVAASAGRGGAESGAGEAPGLVTHKRLETVSSKLGCNTHDNLPKRL